MPVGEDAACALGATLDQVTCETETTATATTTAVSFSSSHAVQNNQTGKNDTCSAEAFHEESSSQTDNKVLRGVPQGSVLVPIMFSQHIYLYEEHL